MSDDPPSIIGMDDRLVFINQLTADLAERAHAADTDPPIISTSARTIADEWVLVPRKHLRTIQSWGGGIDEADAMLMCIEILADARLIGYVGDQDHCPSCGIALNEDGTVNVEDPFSGHYANCGASFTVVGRSAKTGEITETWSTNVKASRYGMARDQMRQRAAASGPRITWKIEISR